MMMHDDLLNAVYKKKKSLYRALKDMGRDLNSYKRVRNIIQLKVTRPLKFEKVSLRRLTLKVTLATSAYRIVYIATYAFVFERMLVHK